MTRPKLLDLFCCEGGASKGYADAGFDVYGVDMEPRVAGRYPFPIAVGDALILLQVLLDGGAITFTNVATGESETLRLVDFDAVTASPPCQAYSISRHAHGVEHPELIAPTRALLEATGLPYIIENVYGAKDRMHSPLLLCGSMFGLTAPDEDGLPLRMERHRLFESNAPLMAPGPCQHDRRVQVAGAYGAGSSDRDHARLVRRGGYVPRKPVVEALLGIDWMTVHGLYQSIPPAYTEYLGGQLMDVIEL